MKRRNTLAERLASASKQAEEQFLQESLQKARDRFNTMAKTYETAALNARADATAQAAGALLAMRNLLRFCQENNLSGEEMDMAEAILGEFDIISMEERMSQKKKGKK